MVVVPPPAGELPAGIGDTEVLIGSPSGDRFRELLAAAPRLRWYQALGAGMERFAPALVTRPSVRVTRCRSAVAPPIAEFALATILAAAKQISVHRDAQHRHDWAAPRNGPELRDLLGLRLCIVGLGAIGGEIARLAAGLGMRVTGVSRRGGPHPSAERTLTMENLAGAAAGSDFLVLACPLTERTRGSVDAAVLAGLTPASWVVNVARAEVIVEAALLDALTARRIAGAALDVMWTEPLPADSPWWRLANVVITPHAASRSPRYRDRLLALLRENLARYRAGEPLADAVDPAAGY